MVAASNNKSTFDLIAGFTGGQDITPSDTLVTGEFTKFSRAIWVGVGGDVKGITTDGSTLTLKNAPSGSLIDGQFKQILSTGTTATNLVAVW